MAEGEPEAEGLDFGVGLEREGEDRGVLAVFGVLVWSGICGGARGEGEWGLQAVHDGGLGVFDVEGYVGIIWDLWCLLV